VHYDDSLIGSTQSQASMDKALTSAPPALLQHCTKVYDKMAEQAVQKTEGLIWEGFLSTVMKEECELGTAYYTQVTRRLQSMRCAQQLKRGGGPQPSIWRLLSRPTLSTFLGADDSKIPKRTRVKTNEDLQQMLRDLNGRVLKLETVARQQGWPI
jgi:hypothetical protein